VIFLVDPFCNLDKPFRNDRVEFEHCVMAGNDKPGVNLFAQLYGFFGAEVAGDAAPEVEPIDGEQGKIDLPIPKSILQTVTGNAIVAVIDRPGASSHYKIDEVDGDNHGCA
jgi:hypothetical protein